jgi:hypothetical protein
MKQISFTLFVSIEVTIHILNTELEVKVKQFNYRPGKALMFPGG